jgi:ribonuclease HI
MKLIYYTDGGCEPNPGQGTWAFVCTEPYHEQTGYEVQSTNNRMEIMAVLQAIQHAQEMGGNDITIYTDSTYVANGFTAWMYKWALKGWQIKGEPVKNIDLWRRLFQFRKVAKVLWVKGHNNNEFNEVCDDLVRTEYLRVFGGKMKY